MKIINKPRYIVSVLYSHMIMVSYSLIIIFLLMPLVKLLYYNYHYTFDTVNIVNNSQYTDAIINQKIPYPSTSTQAVKYSYFTKDNTLIYKVEYIDEKKWDIINELDNIKIFSNISEPYDSVISSNVEKNILLSKALLSGLWTFSFVLLMLLVYIFYITVIHYRVTIAERYLHQNSLFEYIKNTIATIKKWVFFIWLAGVIFIFISIPNISNIEQLVQVHKQDINNTETKNIDSPISFLVTLNPELSSKIKKIQTEITQTKEKLDKLTLLRSEHPRQTAIVDISLNKWKQLLAQLESSLKEIDFKVNGAFVAYKLDQLQGTTRFKSLSKDLLENVNTVLLNVDAIKSTFEKQITN